jgi:putative flippase GtrA
VPRLPDLPHVVVEIGRFMVTGGLSTLTSFLVFNFLAHGLYLTRDPWLESQPIGAFVIANLFGMVVSYQLSRDWAFRHRPPVHPDGGRTAFFVINLVTMPLAIACLWLSRHVLGLTDPFSDNIAGNVVGQLFGQVARFYLFRRYVFRNPVHPSDLAHHPVSLLGPAHRMAESDPSPEDRL